MTCRVSRPQTSWWWHKTPMTILRIGKLMTHLQRRIIHSTFGLSFCYRKWKQKIILASCCRHWSRNPLMLWESLEIPDTILLALWVRIIGAEWKLQHKSSKYVSFGLSVFKWPVLPPLSTCCLSLSTDYWQLLWYQSGPFLARLARIVL